jgi:hypothetical protein
MLFSQNLHEQATIKNLSFTQHGTVKLFEHETLQLQQIYCKNEIKGC